MVPLQLLVKNNCNMCNKALSAEMSSAYCSCYGLIVNLCNLLLIYYA